MTDAHAWDAGDLARRLAENAEAVCRHYLSAGRRHGNYWLVGDVHNTPGRSLYIRLHGGPDGRGRAGKWTELPRFYRRVKLSEDEPYGREEEDIALFA
ncbi:hypothetical protein MSKU15_2956 [Komagataeibacter diospyri]|nr:hypothetical protein MSKU15_2956 [Komagataeibacter diospyri]